tara:strand:- start:8189 stop:9109 length:921 start_codon:yes stop_codon:yes gene_type:complete
MVASELQEAGVCVKVVEKGRGFGGRMATRRMAGARIDHGAQFFTVRSEQFRQRVMGWLDQGIVHEWFRAAPWDSGPEEYPRYRGNAGMTDVAKALAAPLDVERSVRLVNASWSGVGWRAESDGGRSYEADVLILTPPVPQSVALLSESGIQLPGSDWVALSEMDYEPCLTGLFVLSGPSGIPAPGAMKVKDGPVVWMGDNTQKGISPDVSAVTVHSSPEFARQYWDAADDERLPVLIEAASRHLDSDVVEASIHRWRYNVPTRVWSSPFYWNDSFALGLAGDSFGGARIEGAALSGLALSRYLLSS